MTNAGGRCFATYGGAKHRFGSNTLESCAKYVGLNASWDFIERFPTERDSSHVSRGLSASEGLPSLAELPQLHKYCY